MSPVSRVDPAVQHVASSLHCRLGDCSSGQVPSGGRGLILELRPKNNSLPLRSDNLKASRKNICRMIDNLFLGLLISKETRNFFIQQNKQHSVMSCTWQRRDGKYFLISAGAYSEQEVFTHFIWASLKNQHLCSNETSYTEFKTVTFFGINSNGVMFENRISFSRIVSF